MTTISTLRGKFAHACATVTDINEHVATLRAYAAQCDSVCEFGVRSGVSTCGVLLGLAERAMVLPDRKLTLHGYDLSPAPGVYSGAGFSDLPNLHVAFRQQDVLRIAPVSCDMLFIDTFHVYGQLKRELALHAASVRKFIVMHDTTVDGVHGELIRLGMNLADTQRSTGIPAEELLRGLQPALDEFLAEHSTQWAVQAVYTNNNGLTILRRIGE